MSCNKSHTLIWREKRVSWTPKRKFFLEWQGAEMSLRKNKQKKQGISFLRPENSLSSRFSSFYLSIYERFTRLLDCKIEDLGTSKLLSSEMKFRPCTSFILINHFLKFELEQTHSNRIILALKKNLFRTVF